MNGLNLELKYFQRVRNSCKMISILAVIQIEEITLIRRSRCTLSSTCECTHWFSWREPAGGGLGCEWVQAQAVSVDIIKSNTAVTHGFSEARVYLKCYQVSRDLCARRALYVILD